VSGAVSPFERADLGPWLTDPAKIAQWDTLIISKLDRLSRSLIDFAGLLRWCQAHGKVIVSVSESLDFGTAAGRLMAQILMMFAQFERERMSERRADAAVKIRSNGHWGGGAVPYGYQTVKVNSHHELHPDPAQVAVVERIAADIIAGKSLNAISAGLNASGGPTAQGGRWHGSTLGLMLRNAALKGYVQHDGQAVRGDDGMPVLRDPILDDATWNAVQAKLGPARRINRQDGSPYLGVIICGRCGATLLVAMDDERQAAGLLPAQREGLPGEEHQRRQAGNDHGHPDQAGAGRHAGPEAGQAPLRGSQRRTRPGRAGDERDRVAGHVWGTMPPGSGITPRARRVREVGHKPNRSVSLPWLPV
jgi:DNA invertase Pin-like site-specific DNA recombinase